MLEICLGLMFLVLVGMAEFFRREIDSCKQEEFSSRKHMEVLIHQVRSFGNKMYDFHGERIEALENKCLKKPKVKMPKKRKK